jgi:hypothetical protein
LTAFWIAIVLAAVAFIVWTAWPLYNAYKARRRRDYAADDVAGAQAYFKDKAKGDLAQAAADLADKDHTGTQQTGQPAQSDPAAPPSRD